MKHLFIDMLGAPSYLVPVGEHLWFVVYIFYDNSQANADFADCKNGHLMKSNF